MSDILYLVHRLPYPPNKGDKVRSYHLLRHLAARHRVFLGTFVDDPDDARHVPTLKELCAEVHVEPLDPRMARVKSLSGLLSGEALTLPYYRSANLTAWVERVRREQKPDAAVVFSGAMAQYVPTDAGLPTLVDLVDVDSAKWTQYAGNHRWPLSWVYRREGRKLLDFERATVQRAAQSFLVTDAEVELFLGLAPECAGRVEAVGNGVNADYFSPEQRFPSPFAADEIPIVFTGAMDYWPNVDAATWFVSDVLPALLERAPSLRFTIVGMRPTPAVQALAGARVNVTGTVPDVRPYLAHARVIVAPLRVARGVQNKVLEAMAMGRPVVASAECAGGIDAERGTEFAVAAEAADYVERIVGLLADRTRAEAMGAAARARVLERYSWDARLSQIDRWLPMGEEGGKVEALNRLSPDVAVSATERSRVAPAQD
jgi:sugar transferase (PEP-CTERM/EpsH1 system associated)